jgi:type VI protein secretion system component Hcp
MSKNDPSKDNLVEASEKEAIELSESALQKVSGGTSEIHFVKLVDKSSPILLTSTSPNKVG